MPLRACKRRAAPESYNSEGAHNASAKMHSKMEASGGGGGILKDTQGLLESHLREAARMDANTLHI